MLCPGQNAAIGMMRRRQVAPIESFERTIAKAGVLSSTSVRYTKVESTSHQRAARAMRAARCRGNT